MTARSIARGRAALAGAACLACAASSVAWARPARVMGRPAQLDVTSTTQIGWRTDNGDGNPQNDEFLEMFERLNLRLGMAPWSFGARFDIAWFLNEPMGTGPGTGLLEDRFTAEKIFATRSTRNLEVTLGDAYVSFGRGLALSLRKVDELGVDTTVRGIKMTARTEAFETTWIAGIVNVQNVDAASGRAVDDPLDLIGGGRVQVRLGRAELGAHGVAIAFHDDLILGDDDDHYQDQTFAFGPTIELARLGSFDVYLEGVGQVRRTSGAGEDAQGFGAYLATTGQIGSASLLVEAKAYGDLSPLRPQLGAAPFFDAVTYAAPPTTERVQMLLSHEQREQIGGRAQVDVRLSSQASFLVNYGYTRDFQTYASASDPTARLQGNIHDPYAGVRARWDRDRSRADLLGGYRFVLADSGELLEDNAHQDLEIVQTLGTRFSLELRAQNQERGKVLEELEHHREGSVSLGVRVAPWVTLTGAYEYTTEPVQPERDYWNGSLRWDVSSASNLRLFVGSARGGLKCVGGVCRNFPPFEGVQLQATFRL